MVMEFCPGGELFTAIKKQPDGRLTGTSRWYCCSCIVFVALVSFAS